MATFTISQLTTKPSGYTMVNSDVFVMTTGTTQPLLSTVKVTLDDLRTFYEADGNEIRSSVWSTTNSNSSNWDTSYTEGVQTQTLSVVKSNSASWNTAYTQLVASAEPVWNLAYNAVFGLGKHAEAARPNSEITVNDGNRDDWNSVYNTAQRLSASFLSGGNTVSTLGYGLCAWPSSASVYVFNHKTTTPGSVRGVAVCQTAEFNYSVGDEIGVEFIYSEYDSGGTKRRDRPCCALVTNALQISAIFPMGADDEGLPTTGHNIPNASSGSPDETLTHGNWKFKIYYI